MALGETARLVASLELDDKTGKGTKSALANVSKLEKRLGKIGSSASQGIRNAGRNLERGIVIGAGAAAGALTFAAKAAIDWESAVAGVNKTLDGTPAELKSVTDGLRAMATTLPVSAEDLAAVAEAGGQMGVKAKDILAFTKQVAILGTTTNISMDDAATAIGQLQNVIGLTGDEFDNFAAAVVDLGNKGSSTEADIVEITRRSGAAAKTIGLAKDATLAWAAATANLGIERELGGTSLQNFFLKSQRLISGGGKSLEAFAKIAGKSSKDFKRQFGRDASGALQSFIAGLSKMNSGDRTKVIDKLFGKGSGLTRVILGLANSYDKNLIPALSDSEKAWKDATAAQAEADKRFATTASQLSILKNNINDAAISVGSELLPILNDLAKEGVAWIKANQGAIKNFGKDLAVNLRDAVKWAKSLDWNAITGALKAGAGFAKGLIDAFLAAPPWLQEFLAVGFAANKFSGGAITNIGAEIAKAIGGQFLARGASPANPVFVSQVGGTGGLGDKPGANGGPLLATGAAIAIEKQDAFIEKLSNKLFGHGAGFELGGHARGGTFDTAPVVRAIDSESAAVQLAIRDGAKNIVTATAQQRDQFHRVRDLLAKQKTDPFHFIKREAAQGDAHGGILPTIASLVRTFTEGRTPWAQNLSVMKNHLQNLKDAEAAFRAKGDTKTADAIKGQVKVLQGVIDGKLAATNAKLDAANTKLGTIAAQGKMLPGDTRSESSGTRLNANPASVAVDTKPVVTAITTEGTSTRATISQQGATTAAAAAALKATVAAGDAQTIAAISATKATLLAGDTRSESAMARIQGATQAVRATAAAGLAGVKGATQGVATAVRQKDLSVDVNVPVNVSTVVSVRGIVKSTTKASRWGVSIT